MLNKSNLNKNIFLGLIIIYGNLYSKEIELEKIEQLKIGNMALPGSQQPGSLFGFGQNIIAKNEIQSFVFPNFFLGKNKSFIEVIPSVLYGIRDDLSLFIQLPIAARFKSDGLRSSGLEDLILQLEYVFYASLTETRTHQLTLVTSLSLPTGSVNKHPTTGFGSPSFFLGITANHLSTEWYCFLSSGVLLTTRNHKNSKFGNQFFYQTGFGKNIAYISEKWLLTWMLEFTGTYTQKRKINGIINPNSGGNTILFGPSLWFSTQRFILQAGIAPVIVDHLFGVQTKNRVFIALNVGWKFN